MGHLLAKVDNQSLVLYNLHTKTFKTTKACRFGIHPFNFSLLILIVMYINKKYDTVFHCKYLLAVSNLMLAQQYLPLSFFVNVNDGFISLRKKRKQATQRADIFLEWWTIKVIYYYIHKFKKWDDNVLFIN